MYVRTNREKVEIDRDSDERDEKRDLEADGKDSGEMEMVGLGFKVRVSLVADDACLCEIEEAYEERLCRMRVLSGGEVRARRSSGERPATDTGRRMRVERRDTTRIWSFRI
ncbi:hypothetical protein L2E82_22613 [Cichorium intybus]|uniref:Uncharacterized protein n=1 Tax=Cichorium intybus TaxID=13427 RepID=A0ACB9DYP7_CICIN|nr:hypothetical protein L2E82_22613 [Cichorium intybus]